jgi:hypothetical protein
MIWTTSNRKMQVNNIGNMGNNETLDDAVANELKFTPEQIRRFMIAVLVGCLVEFLNAEASARENITQFCRQLRRIGSTIAGQQLIDVHNSLNHFLKLPSVDIGALELLLQRVGGLSANEARVSAPVLARRCGFSSI